MTLTIPEFWVGFAAGVVTAALLFVALAVHVNNKQKAALQQ